MDNAGDQFRIELSEQPDLRPDEPCFVEHIVIGPFSEPSAAPSSWTRDDYRA